MLDQREPELEAPVEVSDEDLLRVRRQLVAESRVPLEELLPVVCDPGVEELDPLEVLAVLPRRFGGELRPERLPQGVERRLRADRELGVLRNWAEPRNCERALRTEGLRRRVASLVVGVREPWLRQPPREQKACGRGERDAFVDHVWTSSRPAGNTHTRPLAIEVNSRQP
jgi:hypothetical protein